MQSLDALNLLPVWVNSDHLAATAKIILAGHKLKVLGVVDGSELVGIITAGQTREQPDSAHIRDFMRAPERQVDVSTPLRDLAETFYEDDLDFLPVMDGDKFRGIVTPNMLLKEMARSWDPLTNLSWSDRLREWGVENLKAGHEITIIFIDLDDFGSYNKKYGHIVGDRVLQKVAEMIQERVSAETDQLVRYGGDEFAIGTTRDQSESDRLAVRLREAMNSIRVAGSDEPVTFSIGVQGGKRTKERENVHYAATLDNLINLASKRSMAEKVAKKRVEPEGVSQETAADLAEGQPSETISVPETEPEIEHAVIEEDTPSIPAGPPHVGDVVADAADANSVTQVSVEVDGQLFTGVCPRKGGSVVKSVALATANAIAQFRPDVQLDIREVNLTESETGVRFISVIGTSRVNDEDLPIGGVGTVGRNLYQTVAEATLQAFTNLEAVREGSR